MKTFKESLVAEIEHSEIDLDYPFYSGEERNEVITPEQDFWYDTESMSIDDAIKSLQELKKKGSNRVYIVAHSDHHSYIFTGVKLQEVKS